MTPAEDQLRRAQELARNAHAGQVDKAGNDYYTHHILDVTWRVTGDLRARTVAYLHDVVEDTPWSLDALGSVGFDGEILLAVDAITHRPHEPRDAYYARVKSDPIALTVKLADIASNTAPERMALLDEPTRERLTRKYAHALDVLTKP